MNNKETEQQIIESYQNDEKMMILIFAQWCINHQLDPLEIYQKAYPVQGKNQALQDALELTVPKKEAGEAGEIEDQTVLQVMQLFGNHDLAFVVQNEIDKRIKKTAPRITK